MSDNVKKWREEREKRLLDRIYGRNRPSTSVRLQPISAAVLGIKRSSENDAKGGQAVARLSLKPQILCTHTSKLEKNNRLSKSSQQLKLGLSCGNNYQRRYTFSHNDVNRRRYTLKCNNNNNINEVAPNKYVKKEGLSTKVVSVTKEMKRDDLQCKKNKMKATEKNAVNTSVATNKNLEADIEDKQNSTFTLIDDGTNVPSPIRMPVVSSSNFRPVDVKLRPILRQPKTSCADMSKKLQEWAVSKGKSLDNYRHLNCFASHVAPKVSCKTPLSTARKVQFKLSGGKTIFMRGNNTNPGGIKKRPLAVSNVRVEEPVVAETIAEVNETSLDFKQNTSNPGEPTARSTPEEQPPAADLQQPYSDDVLKCMTVSALNDLLSVIHGNYSVEACEEWLLAIRRRNLDADLLPEYWECVAAIEEVKGNMYMALDSYHRAIEQGAEVEYIEECLDRMYDKLKALNINAEQDKENNTNELAKKPAVFNSVKKDIFKSTFISFARLQKKVKQPSTDAEGATSLVKYFVTPVRRSTRYNASRLDSLTALRNTPNSFLREDIEENQGSNKVEFKTNRALLNYL